MAEKAKILIIGAGKCGRALVELFSKIEKITIIGVVDFNQDAPGIKLAKTLNIPTAVDYREFMNKAGLNCIFNSTGKAQIEEELMLSKPAGVEVIGGCSVNLIQELIKEREKVEQQLKGLAQRRNNVVGNIDAGSTPIIPKMEPPDFNKQVKKDEDFWGKDKLIESIIQNSAVATFVINSQHKVLYWNVACEELTGTKAKDLLGTSGHWKAFYSHQRPCVADIVIDNSFVDLDKFYKVYRGSTLIPNGLHAEDWYSKLGGKDRYIVFDAAPIYDTEGKLIAAIETLQDITERKKAEDELKKAYTRLKEMQNQVIQAEKLNTIGQLASGVAHEVRNPLGIILQGVNYLENKIPAKEGDVFETLTMLKDSVKRADKIINTLLDFSRFTNLDLRPEDINSILESSLSLVRIKFESSNIDIIPEIKKDVPKVLADRNKLEQVFVNIFLNAIQAMPEGGNITIRSYGKKLEGIENGTSRREEGYFMIGEKVVVVEIEDTGVGIPEENLKKVFEPFFTTKGLTGGVGLGLSVTKNIIHMHRGIIYAESRFGHGAKVTVILKIAE
ncbi:MAG: ATP-binding protein [Candidatus Omnitrophica bacterium]|nr:ATP-binding protein [Candidatus Omnitrophota bacterium]